LRAMQWACAAFSHKGEDTEVQRIRLGEGCFTLTQRSALNVLPLPDIFLNERCHTSLAWIVMSVMGSTAHGTQRIERLRRQT